MRETSAPLNLLFNATSVLRAPPFRGALTSCIVHVRGFSHRPFPSFSYDHKIGQLVELAKNLTLYSRDVECAIAITAMRERTQAIQNACPNWHCLVSRLRFAVTWGRP